MVGLVGAGRCLQSILVGGDNNNADTHPAFIIVPVGMYCGQKSITLPIGLFNHLESAIIFYNGCYMHRAQWNIQTKRNPHGSLSLALSLFCSLALSLTRLLAHSLTGSCSLQLSLYQSQCSKQRPPKKYNMRNSCFFPLRQIRAGVIPFALSSFLWKESKKTSFIH